VMSAPAAQPAQDEARPTVLAEEGAVSPWGDASSSAAWDELVRTLAADEAFAIV
jgi:hypothetical protein